MGARDAGIVLGVLLLACSTPGTSAGSGAGTSAPPIGRARVGSPEAAALADTVLLLPEVRVEAERFPSAARRLPTAFVTEVRAGASGRALETLQDLLAGVPGVHVRQYGGLGAFSTMSVRGASPGQVAVFLDGTPLTSAARGVVSLSDLPATAVERVEVYRGTSPLSLGLPGAGGAVNLVTLSAAPARELRLVRGSFDTWEGRATVGGRGGALSGLAHFGYQGSAGDFSYHDDNGTPFNTADDSVTARRNNRLDASSLLGTLSWLPTERWRVTARVDLFRKRQGLPGLGAVPTRHAGLSLARRLGQVEIESAAGGALPGARLRGGLERERTRFQDGYAELGLGRHDTEDRLLGDHLDLELEWPELPLGLALQAGGTVRREEARLRDAADGLPDPPASRRVSRGATLGLRLRPLRERVVLHAARRWDRLEDRLRSAEFGGLVSASDLRRVLDSPQVGARFAAGQGIELRANWSRAGRAPDFLELFGNQGSVLGNPALRPEAMESWDAGGSWSLPAAWPAAGALTWAHFESRARDLILYVRNSQSSVRAQNVSRARIRGEELGLRLAGPSLGVTASFAWQTAKDAGEVPFWTGKRLPQRAGREGSARLDWRRDRTRVSVDVQHLGDNYLDRYNRYRVARRTLYGASLSMTPFAWPLGLILEGKNLGDSRVADVAGFPLPGRSVFVSLETRLGPDGSLKEDSR